MFLFGFTRDVFKQHPAYLIIITFLMLVSAAAEAIGILTFLPLLQSVFGVAGDDGTLSRIVQWTGLLELDIKALIWIIGAALLIRALVSSLSTYVLSVLRNKIVGQFKASLMAAMVKADWSYVGGLRAGGFANSIVTQSDRAGAAVSGLGSLISNAILTGIFISLSVVFSFELILILGALAVFLYFFVKKVVRKTIAISTKAIDVNSDLNSKIFDVVRLLRYVKSSNLEPKYQDRFDKDVTQFVALTNQNEFIAFLSRALPEIFVLILVTVAMSSVIGTGVDSIEDQFASLLLLLRVASRLVDFQLFFQRLAGSVPSYNFCRGALDELSQNTFSLNDLNPPKETLAFDGNIQFRNINLVYEKTDKVIFKDANLEIPQKGLSILLGPSGSGKSTLIDMLMGLIKPTSGSVNINNRALSDQDFLSLREWIGYSPQDYVIFEGTIRENILLDAEDQSDENLEHVAGLAHVKEFVSDLPDQFETHLHSGGNNLSGGQKQRIVLARALARKPKLLILDEITSSLDEESSAVIGKTLIELKKEMCIIMSTHKESHQEISDYVYQIADKKIDCLKKPVS